MKDHQLGIQIAQSLSRNTSVVAAYAVGSFVQGNARTESDFDLAVVVENRNVVSQYSIYDVLKGIQFPKNLDLSLVDRASSPLFLFQVISKGERIYERTRGEVVQFEAFVLHNYYDSAHIRTIYNGYLKQKFSHVPYANR
ncbi:nucleotidyltransferase domain-containing protein [Candidatus Gottesmanbacteria bacterium]|nr:nucleotidyltransferase domain-containing protein [Candidatus Gottesmanbacteria bacterium]